MPVVRNSNRHYARYVAAEHLEQLRADGIPDDHGWTIDAAGLENNLEVFVSIPTRTADGKLHEDGEYHHRLELSHYPGNPPSIEFVNPATRRYKATRDGKWIPLLGPKPAAIHVEYHPNHGNSGQQLICHTLNYEYYIRGGHNPPPSMVWDPGRHTLASTLLLHEQLLQEPHYGGRRVT